MKNDKSNSSWKTLLKLAPFIKPHGFWVAIAVLCSLCNAILNIAFAHITKNLTDNALNAQYDEFLKLIYLTSVLVAVGMIAAYFSTYATTRYKTQTTRDLRNYITGHIQRLPVSHIEIHHTGDIVSRLNTDVEKTAGLIGSIPDYIYQPFLFIGASTYMLLISWKLLLAIFLLVPISALIFNKISQSIERHSRQLREHLALTNSISQDTIGGISIVKAFNFNGLLSQKYKKAAEQVQNEGLYIDKVNSYLRFVELSLGFIPQLVYPLYGGYLMIQGELTVGSLLACGPLIWYIFLPAEAFLGFFRQMRETAPAMERLVQILNTPTEHVGEQSFETSPDAMPLEFSDVSFSYGGEKNVLNRLSFQLPTGKMVALVGPSGGGKSTVFKLICGYYYPQSGSIQLYGNSLDSSSLSAARAHISIVSQDIYLFPTTIAENIAYGKLNATGDEVMEAAKAANVHDFIMKLPQGYETPVGERGNRLSGGQRQRIALARAILKDAPILLLDEPTAALDTQSEALVVEALFRFMQGRTVLVIAHRLSTIHSANQVLVLDQGYIRESGNHEELMKKESLYKKFYFRQTLPLQKE